MDKIITLGGGCFWCLEAVFTRVKGVLGVAAGYSGGFSDDPNYEAVCSGRSGHAEVVQVKYDDEIVSSEDLLRIFFTIHDPTTPNRQGNDIGPQYRSVIFYSDEEQKQIASSIIEELQSGLSLPISTELTALKKFYVAEEYHQDYYLNHPNQAYCRTIIAPKLKKLMQDHPNLSR